jgi:hypothetical protein
MIISTLINKNKNKNKNEILVLSDPGRWDSLFSKIFIKKIFQLFTSFRTGTLLELGDIESVPSKFNSFINKY